MLNRTSDCLSHSVQKTFLSTAVDYTVITDRDDFDWDWSGIVCFLSLGIGLFETHATIFHRIGFWQMSDFWRTSARQCTRNIRLLLCLCCRWSDKKCYWRYHKITRECYSDPEMNLIPSINRLPQIPFIHEDRTGEEGKNRSNGASKTIYFIRKEAFFSLAFDQLNFAHHLSTQQISLANGFTNTIFSSPIGRSVELFPRWFDVPRWCTQHSSPILWHCRPSRASGHCHRSLERIDLLRERGRWGALRSSLGWFHRRRERFSKRRNKEYRWEHRNVRPIQPGADAKHRCHPSESLAASNAKQCSRWMSEKFSWRLELRERLNNRQCTEFFIRQLTLIFATMLNAE